MSLSKEKGAACLRTTAFRFMAGIEAASAIVPSIPSADNLHIVAGGGLYYCR